MAKFDNRIMTVEELYQFCLKNNFAKFDSLENGKELLVTMNGNFEKADDEVNRLTEGMTHFVSKAFHDHINLNNSQIKPKDFKNNVPSSHLRPILANIKKDEETDELDFGSHDFHIETSTQFDESGNEVEVKKVVYDEQPIGVIDGSQTSIEYDKKAKVNRAIFHGYLYDEYCQDAIDILNRRGTVDCSIELAIRKMSFDAKTKTLVLEDFYVSGLTLLSANTKPGMAGSNFKIEDFSINADAIEFDSNEKLIELLESLNEKLSKFNINNTSGKEEVEVENKENFDEVTETEEVEVTETEETTEEEVTVTENESEETVDETSEEVETVEENSDVEDAEEKKDYSVTIAYADKKFAVSLQEKIYSIQELVNSTYAEADNTYYGVSVYEDYVVMQDYWNGRYFKQTYSDENDTYSLTGDRVEVFAEFVTADEQKELESMRSNYEVLVEYKANAEKNELHAQRESILADEKYSVLAENEAFAKLQKNMDNYSLEDLEKEAKVIFADHVASVGTFALNDEKKQASKKLFGNPNTKKSKASRYGDLFRK